MARPGPFYTGTSYSIQDTDNYTRISIALDFIYYTLTVFFFTDGVFKGHYIHQPVLVGVGVLGSRAGTSSFDAQHVDPTS